VPHQQPDLSQSAHIVTFLANKGGVGKTQAALSMGAAIAAAGGRVLLVDMDQQRNATVLLDPDMPDQAFTVFDVLAAGEPGAALDAAYPTAWSSLPALSAGRLDVVPGDSQLTDQHLIEHGLDALEVALRGAGEQYDVVLLDCPPSTGLVVQSTLVAASRAVLVTQPQHLSILGLQQISSLIDQFDQYRSNHGWSAVQVAGVLISQYDSRRTEHRDAQAEVREGFGTLCWNPPVPERAVVQKATAAHFPLLAYPDATAKGLASVFARLSSQLVRTFHDPYLAGLANRLSSEQITADDLTAVGV
jgi:chromosome partitioning protein